MSLIHHDGALQGFITPSVEQVCQEFIDNRNRLMEEHPVDRDTSLMNKEFYIDGNTVQEVVNLLGQLPERDAMKGIRLMNNLGEI